MSLFQENNMNRDPLYTTEGWEDCGPSVSFSPLVRYSCLLLTPNSFAGTHNFGAFDTQQ